MKAIKGKASLDKKADLKDTGGNQTQRKENCGIP